ncbi:hypothetical protein CERZMDRAFT_97631 [Cercospora zeae-maydis SCOH1-5]|uniref:Uncharacterized protein n=1 Tax=Cercospora zeae-maydis SCOH1-5 TaxID=717836 RepID=A0A6A6FG43_9PEZI|nr:hypothetical protein CERZMDRAFT_97631 [Cercospora zeae-maydis SCOH1-5]
MPRASRPIRAIPAAALGKLSPIDPHPGRTFATGQIPPPEIQFDFSILDPGPSPLQLPSPKRRDASCRSRPHLPTIPQVAETLSSSDSSSSQTTPTPYAASDFLQLSEPVSALLQPQDATNHPPARSGAPELQEDAHTDSQPSRFETMPNQIAEPRAIDFPELMAPRKHCLFNRRDCTDTAQPKYVCYGCYIRTKRQTRWGERLLRKLLFLAWLALQSAVVATIT